MKGSITFRKDRNYWVVNWWLDGKVEKLTKYKGQVMYDRRLAVKLLNWMQNDEEQGTFQIEKYRSGTSDVGPFLWQWIDTMEATLKPGTAKDYRNSIKNHLVPYFQAHPVSLGEIDLMVLTNLMQSIDRAGKGKLNVMYCLHAALDWACRAKMLALMPLFPRKNEYQIQQPQIEWLPEDRQISVIEKIPVEHQPIFWFLKLHFRRPGEAQALHKEDIVDGVFLIHRTFSARKLTDSTKTKKASRVPMVEEFKPWLQKELDKQKQSGIISMFAFVNPRGKLPGKPYSNPFLNALWHKACRAAGENISLYAGTKHSSCTQFIESGGTLSELQEITDHTRLDSVKRYAETTVARRKTLMERRIVKIGRVGK